MFSKEFEWIFTDSNLFINHFANSDVYVWFYMTMQSRADEHISDTYLNTLYKIYGSNW